MVVTKAGTLCAGCCLSVALHAQGYPGKSITMIVPLQAGSAGDVAVRVVAQKIAESLRQQILIDNQPGAAGLIGAQRVARMAPDGYTLGGFSDSVVNYAPSLAEKLNFDPVGDFAPVGLLCSIPWIVVTHPSLPVRNTKELVALAKSAPGKLDYSSAGNGSPHHIAMELFKRATGTDIRHVPYRGASQMITDLVGGQVQVAFSAIAVPLPFIKSGQVRAIAVPSEKRSPLVPNVPTLLEEGLSGFTFNTWIGIFAPKGTGQAIIERLNAEIVVALNNKEVQDRLVSLALEPRPTTPEQLGDISRNGLARVSKVIKDAGIRAD